MTWRVVLDTNVLVSALLFRNGRLSWLRNAWQGHQLQLVMCRETINEVLRVLAYPKFNLSATQQKNLLADLLPFAEVISLPTPWPELSACRDEHDQVFLVLAHVCNADALVTGDTDILALRNVFEGRIITEEELAVYKSNIVQEIQPSLYAARSLGSA